MDYKIVIDAGHGGRDPGAVYEGRQEKNDVLDLALAVGEILEMNGVDVVYTRTEDVYNSPYEKAQIANASGADYFISLHRNAMPVPGTATGIESLVYSDAGEAKYLAEDINEELESVGFVNRGIINRPGLVVLRRTNMPAVLVEAGFIDNEKDNAMFDEHFEEIANAIAQGTLNFLNMESEETGRDPSPAVPSPMTPEPSVPSSPVVPPTPSEPSSPEQIMMPEQQPANKLYRVQVGAFRSQENASRLANQLLREGFPAFVIYKDELYKVQVGAFSMLENAIAMEQRLRNAGYSTFIAS